MNIGIQIYIIFMMVIFASQIVNSFYLMGTIKSSCDSSSLKSNVRGLFVTASIGFSGYLMYYFCQQCKDEKLTEFATRTVYIFTMIIGFLTFIFAIGIHGKLTDRATSTCRVKNEYTAKLFTGIAGIGGGLIVLAVSGYWLYNSTSLQYRRWKAWAKKKSLEVKKMRLAHTKRALESEKKGLVKAAEHGREARNLRKQIKEREREIEQQKKENDRELWNAKNNMLEL